MIVGNGIGMAITGLVIGILAASALIYLLPSFSHLLYGVGNSDPLTLSCVVSILLFAAFVSCYLPARRAMRTDPMNSIRCE